MTLQTARLTLSSRWSSGNFSAQEILKLFRFYILAGGRKAMNEKKRQPAPSQSIAQMDNQKLIKSKDTWKHLVRQVSQNRPEADTDVEVEENKE